MKGLTPARKLVSAIAITLITATGCAVTSTQNNTNQTNANQANVKLYAMDCGTTDVSDLREFSRTGKLDGETLKLAVPCFLIRHPKGDLIWDTGHPQAFADMPNGYTWTLYHMEMKTNVIQQLSRLNLSVDDIEYLSLSHYHPDHSGQANLFAGSTFIVNAKEHQAMFPADKKARQGYFDVYSQLENAKTVKFDTQHDVFGDGTVVTKVMPGHTPGHSVLQLELDNAGTVLLTGDLFTHAKARELKVVPTHVPDAAIETFKDSMAKFEALAKKEQARVIIQHDPVEFAALPQFPAYLD